MARAFIPHVVTEDSALGGSFLERSLRFNDDDGAYRASNDTSDDSYATCPDARFGDHRAGK